MLFGSLSLNVSAASDNLISSDLTEWTDLGDLQENSFPINVTQGGNIYRVTLSEQDYIAYYGAILDHSRLIAGHSYTLSLKMPTREDINTAFGKSYSESVFNNHFENAVIYIGICFISPSGVVNFTEDYVLFNIDSTNYKNFFGKSLNASFVASNYSGTPCVFIEVASIDGASHSFYFSDFSLVDNDDNSDELTGIRGFLHSIRWDLVGGVCEEEDCPHSSANNPHLSLSERMSAGFSSMFAEIGDKFEEGSTLNVWFNGLSDKVGNLDLSLSSLGDRMSGFFSGLGDRISGFFSDLGSDIGGFFSDLKTNMSNWFSELGDSITTKFQEIGDKFTEFFDKFKPRVYMNFEWHRGTVNGSTGEIIYNKNDAYPNIIVSDLFSVSDGTVYLIDYTVPSGVINGQVAIYQYDLQGKFIQTISMGVSAFEAYELPIGYQYRFRMKWYQNVEVDSDAVNDYFSVYAEEGWINALMLNMKMGIRNLFVPDEQYILDWKDSLDLLLQEHLGIIYSSIQLIGDLIDKVFDIVFNAPDIYSLTVPKVEFEISDTYVILWEDMPIDFSFLDKQPYKGFYGMYTVALYVLFGALEVKYGLRVYRRMMSN